MKNESVDYIVHIGDTHCGCRLGLYPADAKFRFDEGGTYSPSAVQKWMWKQWNYFWGEFVPAFTKGRPFAVVHAGDAIDGGMHHQATTPITGSIAAQIKIASEILKPIVDLCDGRFYLVRGTDAHDGPDGQHAEELGEIIGAHRFDSGRYSTDELNLEFGEGKLCNVMHHIGGSSSSRSKSTAVMAELAEIWTNAGRWQTRVPDIVQRGHRHEYIKVEMATHRGDQFMFVTPAWQLKTPFGYKISGARTATPQIGGCITTYSRKKKKLWVDKFVAGIEPAKENYVVASVKYKAKGLAEGTK